MIELALLLLGLLMADIVYNSEERGFI